AQPACRANCRPGAAGERHFPGQPVFLDELESVGVARAVLEADLGAPAVDLGREQDTLELLTRDAESRVELSPSLPDDERAALLLSGHLELYSSLPRPHERLEPWIERSALGRL